MPSLGCSSLRTATPIRWVLAAVTTLVAAGVLTLIGAPSPPLFAGVLGGAVMARGDVEVLMPRPVRSGAMMLVGAAAGASLTPEVLATVIDHPAVVLGGVAATLAVTLAAGQLLRLHRDVSGVTATFASIAGGASGVSLLAEEYGADAATVMTLQYLRVLVVMVSVPLIAPLLASEPNSSAVSTAPAGSLRSGFGFTVLALLGGWLLMRAWQFSASQLLLPLVAAAGLAASGLIAAPHVPSPILDVGYAAIGLDIGFGLTNGRIARLARLLPLGLLQLLISVAICGMLGMLMATAVGVSALDGYLATTPGGLPAVMAIAVDLSSESGLIITMQFVRVFLALVCAPLVGSWLRRRRTPSIVDSPPQ